MNKAPPHSRAGFTLVELLVGATLSAAVMAAVLSSYIFLAKHFVRLTNQQTLETEARRTLAYFTRDVQMATGLTVITAAPTSPAANRVDLTVPAATSSNTITYYYNSTASDAVLSVNGSNITMAANALTRCVYNGTTVTSQTLLRNITSSGLTFNYYDTSGNAYTTYVDYLSGIKQLMLQFSTQTGVNSNGTQTLVYRISSNRLIVRNKALLP